MIGNEYFRDVSISIRYLDFPYKSDVGVLPRDLKDFSFSRDDVPRDFGLSLLSSLPRRLLGCGYGLREEKR